LPTIVFLLCPFILWVGKDRYITSPPTGSVLASALRLWRFAARGRWSWNPVELIRVMTADDFWENAKPSKQASESIPRWMTFDDQWVDEVRRGFKACTVSILFGSCNNLFF
jgi:POT family proton-dependent oligopeptide transporter